MSELPKGWVESELKELCYLITDGTHHSPPNGPTGTYKYVTAKNIRQYGLDEANITFVDRSTHDVIYKRCPVKKGDILYIKDGATTGLAIVNPLDEEFSMLSSVALIRPAELLDAGFLKWQLNSPAVFARITGNMTGSAIRRLTLTTIGRQRVRVPPLAEQKRIVAKLDTLSARSTRARAELDRIDTLVKRYKQAVLSKAFSGELTRDRKVASWEQLKLGDLLEDIRYGTSKKCAIEPVLTPVLRIPNISGGKIDKYDLKYADFDEKEFEKLRLRKGDILVIRSNGSLELVGRSAVVDTDAEGMLFAGYLIRLRLKLNSIDPVFLQFGLQAPEMRKAVEALAKSTSGVNNINSQQIQGLDIRLPDIPTQKEIVRRIESAFGKIDRLAAEAKRALELTDRLDEAILAKAFRGELVPQDPDDEPASVLLERIKAERAAAPKAKRGKKEKA